jgi:type IV secretory pathway ATPase VirB11/archaellum biosynthesis ATPase
MISNVSKREQLANDGAAVMLLYEMMSVLDIFVSGPNSVVIVTHIDSLCPEVNDDITKVFDSAAVDKVIKRASTITGVPVGYIFPVKNYVTEQDVSTQVNILLLLAMQRIVNFSIDVIKGRMRDNYTANGTKTMD